MANLQKRSGAGLTRNERETRAFRVVQVGAVAGVGFVVTTVLWFAGALSGGLPVVFALVSALCGVRFRSLTRKR